MSAALAQRMARAPGIVLLVIGLGPFAIALLYPQLGWAGLAVPLALMLAAGVAAWRNSPLLARLDAALLGREVIRKGLLLVATPVVFLGGLELAALALTSVGLVGYHTAIQTMLPPGTSDYRVAHITGDEFREPDPVLLWRPVASAPYTEQRLKGALLEVPKPSDTVRIIAYGDSNTDGPRKSSWPVLFGRLLQQNPPAPGKRYEVANAGVAGYSSYQGRRRFESQVEIYQPDIVLVSFGWNDLASALGPPDREFQAPTGPMVGVSRFLLRYRLYLVLEYALGPPPLTEDFSLGRRVPLDDYLDNLAAFYDKAEAAGARVVFLTRPHYYGDEVFADADWRNDVPLYNEALLAFAKQRNAIVVDVDAFFEKHPELFVDQCHFTREGRYEMARILFEARRSNNRQAFSSTTSSPASPPVCRRSSARGARTRAASQPLSASRNVL